MFEQLLNELGGPCYVYNWYSYSATLAISLILTLVFGYKYWDFKKENGSLHVAILRGLFLNQELVKVNSELREKLKKYEKVKKPLTETKHEIKSKLKELK